MYFDFLIKFLRYGGGSIIALSVDVGMLLLIAYATPAPYLLAAAIAFVFGGVAKYLVSTYFVYEDNRGDDKTMSIVWFILIALCGLAANHTIIYLSVEYIGLSLFFAKVISAGFVFVMNFLLLGVIVFKDPLINKNNPSYNSVSD